MKGIFQIIPMNGDHYFQNIIVMLTLNNIIFVFILQSFHNRRLFKCIHENYL